MASTLRSKARAEISSGLSVSYTRGCFRIASFSTDTVDLCTMRGLQGPIPILAMSTLLESVCEDIHSF